MKAREILPPREAFTDGGWYEGAIEAVSAIMPVAGAVRRRMCWHREIDHETGICKDCGAKAAIKLKGMSELPAKEWSTVDLHADGNSEGQAAQENIVPVASAAELRQPTEQEIAYGKTLETLAEKALASAGEPAVQVDLLDAARELVINVNHALQGPAHSFSEAVEIAKHALAARATAAPPTTPYKGPINQPCSACSAGDTAMKYHDHEYVKPEFRIPAPASTPASNSPKYMQIGSITTDSLAAAPPATERGVREQENAPYGFTPEQWQQHRKFGTCNPHRLDECKICGCTWGEHCGSECPPLAAAAQPTDKEAGK